MHWESIRRNTGCTANPFEKSTSYLIVSQRGSRKARLKQCVDERFMQPMPLANDLAFHRENDE